MAREFLWIIKESAYKTPMGSPVAGTDSIYLRLDGGNAFRMRPKPLQRPIMYGGGFAVPAFTVSDQIECKGTLQTKLYAAQAHLLLDWAGTRINAAQTAPWTTTEPAGDLASCSVYHAIQRSDGTYKRRVYLGTKVTGGSIECRREAPVATLRLDLQASTPQGNQFDSSSDPSSTAFPAPAETAYPSDPYLFLHTAGNLSIGGARTLYSAVKIDFANKLDARFFENRFVNLIRFLGRESMLTAKLYYKPTPDDRTLFEGLAAQTLSLAFNNGTHSATFTFNAQNVYKDLNDDLPLDQVYEQEIQVSNHFDPVAAADWSVAFT
jgi:hypothetical protein